MIRALGILLLMLAAPASAQLLIAHRGASGERPEHTLAAYERAIDQGADYIETDLVPTKDGVLIARHENEISQTTDVAQRPEFAARKVSRLIEGRSVEGWFSEDFTLAELRTLRARERAPALRPANVRFDGLSAVPTFAEIIQLVRAKEAETGRRIGLYPELKHWSYFKGRGVDTAALLVTDLTRGGYSPADPVFVQSFEVAPLERLARLGAWKRVQLAGPMGGPVDRPGTTYAAMLTAEGLAAMRAHAEVLGVEMRLVLAPDGTPTPLVALAHKAGLKVHVWTLRRENSVMLPVFRKGTDPAGRGEIERAWAAFKAAGVDGIITDNPGDVRGLR